MIKSFSVTKLFDVANISLDFNEDISVIIGDNGTFKTHCFEIINFLKRAELSEIFNYNFEALSFVYVYNDSEVSLEFIRDDNSYYFIPRVNNKIDQNFCATFMISDTNNETHNSETFLRSLSQKVNSIESSSEVLYKLFLRKHPIRVYFLPISRYTQFEAGFIDYETTASKINHLVGIEYRKIDIERRNQSAKFQHLVFENLFTIQSSKDSLLNFNLIEKKELINLKVFLNDLKLVSPEVEKNFKAMLKIHSDASDYLKELKKSNSQNYSNSEMPYMGKVIEDVNNNHPGAIALFTFDNNYSQMEILRKLSEEYKNSQLELDTVSRKLNNFLSTLNSFFEYTNNIRFTVSVEGDLICNKYFNGVDNPPTSLSLTQLSSGEFQITLLLALSLLETEAFDTLMIDEPELSMHSAWQLDFIQTIHSSLNNVQIIAASHSPQISQNLIDKRLRNNFSL